MKSDENPLEIFFQKLPLSTALFDRQLNLRRCNPTWVNTIDDISQAPVIPGAYFYALLPGTERLLQPFIDQTLAGTMTTVDDLRLSSSNNVFYWDAAFVPWVEDEQITGFLLMTADVTERVLSRQILERKVVDRTQKLSALYDVMTVAAEPVDLKHKLDESLQRVIDAVHAQAGSIHLLDDNKDVFLLATANGLPATVAGRLKEVAGRGGFLRQFAPDKPCFVLEETMGGSEVASLLRDGGFVTCAGVPMTTRGKTIGMLGVYRQSRRPFSQQDIALLDSVADQIGTAVENARLSIENEQLLIVEERNRLARELHDAITQSLYSLTLYAETSLRFMHSDRPQLAGEYMNQVAQTAQQALREMRLLLHNLRPAVLEQLGLEKAIRQRIDAVEKRVGVSVDYQIEGKIALPAHVEEALYHIVQEALNNALKHAAANRIILTLCQKEKKVTLTIADDGRGFDLQENGDGGGLGLTSMRERVDSLGGELLIKSAAGKGSEIRVDLDLSQAGAFVSSQNLLDALR